MENEEKGVMEVRENERRGSKGIASRGTKGRKVAEVSDEQVAEVR